MRKMTKREAEELNLDTRKFYAVDDDTNEFCEFDTAEDRNDFVASFK